MLALVDTLEEWRHYLLGVTVLVYRQLGVELLAEEPEAIAEAGEVVGEATAV